MRSTKARLRISDRSSKRSATQAEVDSYFSASKPYVRRSCAKRIKTYNEDTDSDFDTSDCIIVSTPISSSFRHTSHESTTTIEGEDVMDMNEPASVCKLLQETKVDEVSEDSASGKLFKKFPYELHQAIVEYLPTDRDVHNYRFVCHRAKESVDSTVWRKRFLQTFDPITGADSMDYFKKYRYRCEVSESWTAFDMKSVGTKITPKMRQIQLALQDNKLKLFKTLICESDAREVVNQNGCKVVDGLNMNFIRNLISNKADQRFVDLIDSVLCTDFDDCFGNNNIVSAKLNNTLIFVIQLILTPISLHPHFCNAKVSHFDLSQYQVYTTTKSQPLFVGRFKQDINVRWLLHTVNFFKFHLKAGVGEGILSDAYNNLDPHQYPQPWVGPIRSGTHILGKNWKGVHNFLVDEDLHELRSDGIRGIYCDHGEIFQDLEIFFDEEKFPAQNWLENWEEFLPSNPFQVSRSPSSGRRPSRTKTTLPNLDIKTFYGTSQCTKKAYFYGRIHAMPQQQGLIGFQRIVVLKYYPAPSGEFDFEQVYCYEGCVFPGNKVIVGRWWHQLGDPKANTTQSGPFIWWNVDRNGSGAEGTGDEALNFYEEYLNI